MNKELDEITIVLISYKSADKIKKFIKKCFKEYNHD